MVLICYDGSATARHAIAVAHAALGHKLAIVLHVWEPPPEFLQPDPFGGVSTPTGPPLAELEAIGLERAGAVADEGHELARSAGFAVETRIEREEGSIWRTIIAVADDIDAELIVLGARGLSTVESALLGSISNSVLHHSRRPVLIVPAAGEDA